MPRLRLALALVPLALAGLASPAAAQAETVFSRTNAAAIPGDAPHWRTMGDAMEAARTDSSLVLVHTYAVWCTWCARLDREVYTDDAVQAYLAEHYAATRIDIESDEEIPFYHGATVPMRALAQAFEVTGTPTTLFFSSDGRFLTRMPGYAPPDRFLLVLRYVREGAYTMMPFPDWAEMQEANAPATGAGS